MSDESNETETSPAIDDLQWAIPDLRPDACDRLLDLVRRAEAENNTARQAQATYHLARAHGEAGRFDVARKYLDDARHLYRLASDELGVQTVALGDMALDLMTGKPRSSIDLGGETLRQIQAMEATGTGDADRKILERRIRSNLVLALAAVGEFDEAIVQSDLVLANGATARQSTENAIVLANRGYLLCEMGRPRMALQWLEESIEIFDSSGIKGQPARALAWSARCLAMIGETEAALERLHTAQDAVAYLPDAMDHLSIAVDMARVYSLIGRDREAIELLDIALPRLATSGLLNDRAAGHLIAARVTADAGSPQSRDMFHEARDLFRDLGRDLAAARCVLSLAELGPIDDRAAAALEDERETVEQFGTVLDRARWRLISVESGHTTDPERRRIMLREAHELCSGLPAPHVQWRVAYQRGLAEIEIGDGMAGRAFLSDAVRLFQRLRASIPADWMPSTQLLGPKGAVDRLCATLLELDRGADLARVVDRSFGLITGYLASERPDLEVADVRVELCVLFGEMLDADHDRLDAMRNGVIALERSIEPLLASAPTNLPAPVDRPSPANQAIIYGEHHDELFCVVFEVDGTARIVRQLCSASEVASLELERAVLRHRSAIPALADEVEAFRARELTILGTLYELMIEPLDLELDPERPLLVTSPACAVNVPFGALHDNGKFLVEATTITLSLGPVSTDALAVRALASTHSPLRSIPSSSTLSFCSAGRDEASRAEAVAVAELTGGHALEAAETTQQLVQRRMSGATCVHIADHTPSGHQRGLTGLQLADGWSDVRHWNLDGQLVVLSGHPRSARNGPRAVDSAARRVESFALARAFIAAGATGVVLTKADIEPSEAMSLMTCLHEKLRSLPPDLAVRATQIEMRECGAPLATWSNLAYAGCPSEASGRAN